MQNRAISSLSVLYAVTSIAAAASLICIAIATLDIRSSLTGSTEVRPTEASASALATSETQCEPATTHQAATLLGTVFPNVEIIEAKPAFAGVGEACLLEVELYADRAYPSTHGIVYVLPGGEHFLNGPIMNSSSQLSLSVGETARPSAPAAIDDNTATGDPELDELLRNMPDNMTEAEMEDWLKKYILRMMLED